MRIDSHRDGARTIPPGRTPSERTYGEMPSRTPFQADRLGSYCARQRSGTRSSSAAFASPRCTALSPCTKRAPDRGAGTRRAAAPASRGLAPCRRPEGARSQAKDKGPRQGTGRRPRDGDNEWSRVQGGYIVSLAGSARRPEFELRRLGDSPQTASPGRRSRRRAHAVLVGCKPATAERGRLAPEARREWVAAPCASPVGMTHTPLSASRACSRR